VVFLDFFRYDKSVPQLPDSEESRELNATRLRLKRERRSIQKRFAQKIGVSTEAVPLTQNELTTFIRDHVYGSLTSPQRKAKENEEKVSWIDPNLISLAKTLTDLTEQIGTCRQDINRLRSSLREPPPDVIAQVAGFFAAAQDEISRWFLTISTTRSFIRR